MADHRRRDAICTVSGRAIRPLDPNPADIFIEDIAHSLGNQCRYTGHTSSFYSVAQHSVHVSQWIEMSAPINETTRESLLWGLLHDASEIYLSDIARPIKRAKHTLGEAYTEVEEVLLRAVAEAFELPWPIPKVVKEADNIVGRAESRDLMPEEFRMESWGPEPDDTKAWVAEIQPWSPKRAKSQFLWRYKELTR